ncbi:MAG: SRPBCC family protein [Cyanobacteria bacterium]|nr:SRPBCC family protein [Cyanobacteriota bacterium]
MLHHRLEKILVLYTVAASCCVQQSIAQEFKNAGTGGITGSILIEASPEHVFKAIKQSRYQEPGRRHVESSNGNEVVLYEDFMTLPIIGKASCRYKEVECPGKRIDYSLIESSQFKDFHGAWELTPMKSGQATLLKLTSCIDMYVMVPFKRQITNAGTKKDISRRLNNIKRTLAQNNS